MKKPFTKISKGILDTIACSWWPNDGPVHLRRPAIALDDEFTGVVIPMVKARAMRPIQERVSLVLKRAQRRLTTDVVGDRAKCSFEQALGALKCLREKGLVKCVRQGGPGEWEWIGRRTAEDEEREAAE